MNVVRAVAVAVATVAAIVFGAVATLTWHAAAEAFGGHRQPAHQPPRSMKWP